MNAKLKAAVAGFVLAAVPFAGGAAAGPATAHAATPQAVPSRDATASLYVDGRLVARAIFHHHGDRFDLAKWSRYGHRPYLDYRYVRVDGTTQTGRHRGVSRVGMHMLFDHNFGEGRGVWFRVCVQVSWAFDPCSGWSVGYA